MRLFKGTNEDNQEFIAAIFLFHDSNYGYQKANITHAKPNAQVLMMPNLKWFTVSRHQILTNTQCSPIKSARGSFQQGRQETEYNATHQGTKKIEERALPNLVHCMYSTLNLWTQLKTPQLGLNNQSGQTLILKWTSTVEMDSTHNQGQHVSWLWVYVSCKSDLQICICGNHKLAWSEEELTPRHWPKPPLHHHHHHDRQAQC